MMSQDLFRELYVHVITEESGSESIVLSVWEDPTLKDGSVLVASHTDVAKFYRCVGRLVEYLSAKPRHWDRDALLRREKNGATA